MCVRVVFRMLLVALAFSVAPRISAADDLPPVLTDFGAANPFADYWIMEGTVEDEDPEGCIIVFGGVLEGHWVSANADGSFALVLLIPPGIGGVVTAEAVDAYGKWSDPRYDVLDNYY